LKLGKPFKRSLVDKMEDTSVWPSSSEIIHDVSIFKGSGVDGFASRSRYIVRKLLLGFTSIDTVIRDFGMEANGSVRVLL
jgi:hypothetical protein